MDDSNLTEQTTRYAYRNHPHGIGESQPLDFHSPYGCSKGTADQYVRDYNRIYDIPSVVFRQSCIYGPHQFGIEDQGWVAWFVIAALSGNPITVYGDGKQVRDVLHVHDLVRAYELAADCPERVNGKIYNIGGGTRYTLSIIELLFYLERRLGHSLGVTFAPWRAGDQRVYISDVRRVQRDLDWSPSIEPLAGVDALLQWVDQHRPLLAKALHIEMFPVMQVNP